MNIDFTQVLVNFEGDELKEPDTKKIEELGKQLRKEEITQDEFDKETSECLKPITLRSICVNALLSEEREERSQEEDKIKRYELAKAIFMNDALDLEVEPIALLKKRVGKRYLPMIVGQAFKLLEGKTDGGTDKPVDNA